MSPKVEKRREFLISIAYLAVIFAIIYVFFKYLFWVTAPFILTFFFAVLLQKPLRALDKKTQNKHHTLWSVLLVILSIIIVLFPLGMILGAVISKVAQFFKFFVEQMNDIPSFLTTLENKILGVIKILPDSLYKSASESVQNFFTPLIDDFDLGNLGINFNTVKNGLTTGVSGMMSMVKNVPSVAIGVIIGIIAWIFFTKDYNYIVRFIQKQLPDKRKNLLVEIKQVFSKTILKMVRAYGLIMLITFFELFLGFSVMSLLGVMKNSYYILIAVLIAIFDILPIAGSGGILVPWALISLVLGNYKQTIGIVIMYALITVIRQYIEPKIVGDSLGVHPIVTLMGLYFGLKLFGFMGMFIVPLTVMTLKAFNDTGRINLWEPVERIKLDASTSAKKPQKAKKE